MRSDSDMVDIWELSGQEFKAINMLRDLMEKMDNIARTDG